MQRLVLFLAGSLAAFAAHAEQVIPPGRESFFLQLVAQPLPGCTSKDISLQKDHAVLHFECPKVSTVELYPRSSPLKEAVATDRFKVVVSASELPAKALAEFTTRIRTAEKNWQWLEVTEGTPNRQHHSDGNNTDPDTMSDSDDSSPFPHSALDRVLKSVAGINGRPGYYIGLILPIILLLVGVARLLQRRTRSPGQEQRTTWEGGELAGLGPLVVAIALAGLLLSTFRPMNDDFTYLLLAKFRPSWVEFCLRFFSVTVPYYLAVKFAPAGYPHYSQGVLIAQLAIVYAALMTVMGMLARRLGASRGAAIMVAGFVGMLPFGLEQLRVAFCLQPLMLWTLAGTTLLVADSAARETDAQRRGALTWIALGLTGMSVFVKSPLAPVVPVMVWMWGRLVVRDAQGAWKKHRFYGLFALAIAIPLLCAYPLTTNQGELGKAGISAIMKNLHEAWLMSRSTVLRLRNVALALLITGAWAWWRRRGTEGESPVRVWVLPLFIGVTLAPHLFNRSYFASYYLFAPLIWSSLLLVVVCSRFVLRHQALALAQGLLATMLLIPREAVEGHLEQFTHDRRESVLRSIHAATASSPKPCGVILRSHCSDPELGRKSTAALRDILFQSDGNAIKWAIGWSDVETIIEGEPVPASMHQCPQPLFIDYCESQPVRVATQ